MDSPTSSSASERSPWASTSQDGFPYVAERRDSEVSAPSGEEEETEETEEEALALTTENISRLTAILPYGGAITSLRNRAGTNPSFRCTTAGC
eukprot:8339095-Pyramimonas_sp.AAC.1